ncbi:MULTISPECIES: AbrB/MazE/SpoVT family DNA-binding domain-containing protein [Alicyclobacillus]|uniref:AbrB family looped-hinge helix DNA binding protein n=1 Tax=Alicyclobacillus tolerans TaxID=90970 RepID=A0ABT9LYJ5_9BACL|nr:MULTISPECIES: AbrB/MazE/SpoVT family DNA-binding domain-containing protein [Alicyclobacillus]MDP9729342.1 AbrB family looped-hinge helix DNA binding protein [Alicyclobacillus tengchongensis]
MLLSIVRLSQRFQITLPVEVRELLQIQPNDRIAFRTDDTGRVYLENLKSIQVNTVRGLLQKQQWTDHSAHTTTEHPTPNQEENSY